MLKPTENVPEIKARKMQFDFKDVQSANFWDNNSILSSYFAALSATFPPGEKEFIESVRLYRGQVHDPRLEEEIAGFIGQESQHSIQHRQINEAFEKQGWSVSRIETLLKKKIERQNRTKSSADRLAKTVSLEHVTAIMSAYILNNPHILSSLPPSTRELFLWHTVEEIEHKSVAFDVYNQLIGDRKKLRRIMLASTLEFVSTMFYYQVLMHVWARSWPSFKDWIGAYKFFFGKGGMVPGMAKSYREFFTENFHPWQDNNTHLIQSWIQENPA